MTLILVDKNDNPIGLKERKDLLDEDICRVSALWLTNSKGEVLLAQRALTKQNDPGKWGPAVAGTVEEGETYESNIVKEAEEEIGLAPFEPVFFEKIFINTDHKYFCAYFKLQRDVTEFRIQADEVIAVRWFLPAELHRIAKEKPDMFTQSLANLILKLC
jgi:isopentenyl-diphosphate Delta-isomerase